MGALTRINLISEEIHKSMCSDILEEFETIRRKALELFRDDKLSITDHALERMVERDIAFEDIGSVFHCQR